MAKKRKVRSSADARIAAWERHAANYGCASNVQAEIAFIVAWNSAVRYKSASKGKGKRRG